MIKFFLRTITILGLFWLFGLANYIYRLVQEGSPEFSQNQMLPQEATVLLTGGQNRLKVVANLLKKGAVKRLLITGVNKNVVNQQVFSILKATKEQIKCCIDIGYKAKDTQGNANEARDWVLKHDFKHIRLVTSLEHMPRALHVFSDQMPDIKISPYPVGIWRSENVNIYGLLREYNKYLYSLLHSYFA